MIQKISTIILFLGLFSAGLHASGKHLFILSGQSNMAGLDPVVSFTPTVEAAFGKENITVVKDAQSGAPIRCWFNQYEFPDKREIKGNEKDRIGKKYADLIKAVKATTDGASYDSVTFVWMQGERDARESLSEVYAESFNGILDQLKADLDLQDINFVIGRISDFDMENKKYPHWTKIREIQVELAEGQPNGAWVDTDDLNGGQPGKVGGGLHYNKAGYATLGTRFAEKSIALIKKQQ